MTLPREFGEIVKSALNVFDHLVSGIDAALGDKFPDMLNVGKRFRMKMNSFIQAQHGGRRFFRSGGQMLLRQGQLELCHS